MIREGGIWDMGWTSYTKYNLQIFVQTENTQCVCNVHFRAVGMMREREGRVGCTSFTKYKPSDFCTVRMYTLYNLKHQQYEKYFLLPPLPTHLHPLYLFPSITPIHMYCLYCVLYKSTNFIIGNFLYFYKYRVLLIHTLK